MDHQKDRFTVRFLQRDWTTELGISNSMIIPKSWSRSIDGGELSAEFEVIGDARLTWELAANLRGFAEIFDTKLAQVVWRGVIYGVQGPAIDTGEFTVSVSLDSMANRVRAFYTTIEDSNVTKTGWYDYSPSQDVYGIKETQQSLPASNTAAAEGFAQLLLSQIQVPLTELTRAKAQKHITVTCRGIFETLDWRKAQRQSGLIQNSIREEFENMGQSTANTKVAQSFMHTAGESFDIGQVGVWITKEGSPADNVRVAIHSDSSGEPGTELAFYTVAAASITSGELYIDTLGSIVTLADSTLYWIVISRSGGNSGTDYYKISISNSGDFYTPGEFFTYNGTIWATGPANEDIAFKIIGQEETTLQIVDMVGSYGQFYDSVRIADASGVYTPQYRNGNSSVKTEVVNILNQGTSTGLRLVADTKVEEYSRSLQISAESDGSIVWQVKADGSVVSHTGHEIEKSTCPVNFWGRYDVIDPTLERSIYISDPSEFYVEVAEYNPEKDELTLTTRGFNSIWSAFSGGIQNA